jgi:hypothetical protein
MSIWASMKALVEKAIVAGARLGYGLRTSQVRLGLCGEKSRRLRRLDHQV